MTMPDIPPHLSEQDYAAFQSIEMQATADPSRNTEPANNFENGYQAGYTEGYEKGLQKGRREGRISTYKLMNLQLQEWMGRENGLTTGDIITGQIPPPGI